MRMCMWMCMCVCASSCPTGPLWSSGGKTVVRSWRSSGSLAGVWSCHVGESSGARGLRNPLVFGIKYGRRLVWNGRVMEEQCWPYRCYGISCALRGGRGSQVPPTPFSLSTISPLGQGSLVPECACGVFIGVCQRRSFGKSCVGLPRWSTRVSLKMRRGDPSRARALNAAKRLALIRDACGLDLVIGWHAPVFGREGP